MEQVVRHKRKTKTGQVVSAKMDKTVVVQVDTTMRHPRYEKVVKRSKRFYAHDPSNNAQEGDTVTIMEVRPLSKTKRWRIMENAASNA